MTTKTTTTKIEVEEMMEQQSNMLKENARTLMLAGFGLVGFAQDQVGSVTERFGNVQEEMMNFFGELVTRGEKVEAERREQATKFVETYRNRAKDTAGNVETELDKQMDTLVSRLNVPTADDITTLTKKLDSLNRKVTKLQKTQTEALAKKA